MEYFKREMRIKDDKVDSKLVGAEIPINIFYYLNLFCVADSRSKTSIVRPLIEKWYKKAVKDFPEKKLIDLVSKMGFENWKNRNNKRITFNAAMKKQRIELSKKGIAEKTIDEIIKRIENAKSKED